ncbi:NAD-dependent succinate-semialdehyde dehydrogenase [Colwellia sp. UCD-KL20]|uniref:NAD-dependent succinate-semialdehyde dehydrogenase n=1 Tax=Colwellia sp. UCD-KL20 TaxID=1917165 RepID=UPI000970D4C9|nr:NAD-dependent succinate-semialdehyde dehydrogenase [Colwellia sp. UCD-KL20]
MQLTEPSLLKNCAYINGEWIKSDKNQSFVVNNPATGDLITNVESVSTIQTEQAVLSAEKALTSWKKQTAQHRSQLLRRWYDLLLENQDDLALIMTLEQGKPLAEAKGEVAYGASYIEWFAEEGKRVYGDVIPSNGSDKRFLTIKQPVGVVAAITPWNFPIAMITRKAAPALAAGCTIVIKPASETPLCALALAELADRAGIPAGVINVITGSSREIGAVLTSSLTIRKLSFTGSTPVGKLLLAQCAQTVKKTSMELGGNAPFIVFDDADIDEAIKGLLASKFRNAGQTCVCANRILVQEGIYDLFTKKLAVAVSQFVIGQGDSEGVTIGPLVTEKAAQDVDSLVRDALSKGAIAIAGGQRHEFGYGFYQPTILTQVTDDMRVFREEIFGPVAPLFKFKDEEQAIKMANDTEFGLASYIYTRDIGRIWRVSEAIEYGIVGINEGIISTEVAPFGGVKESGSGREGSKYGIEDYTEIKYLCMGGLER